MSKATNIKCEYCHQVGFHKMSCPTQKATVFIPTLEGDEAEEFIRKADENVRLMRQRFIDKAKELQERYDNEYLKMQELISKEANVVTESTEETEGWDLSKAIDIYGNNYVDTSILTMNDIVEIVNNWSMTKVDASDIEKFLNKKNEKM